MEPRPRLCSKAPALWFPPLKLAQVICSLPSLIGVPLRGALHYFPNSGRCNWAPSACHWLGALPFCKWPFFGQFYWARNNSTYYLVWSQRPTPPLLHHFLLLTSQDGSPPFQSHNSFFLLQKPSLITILTRSPRRRPASEESASNPWGFGQTAFGTQGLASRVSLPVQGWPIPWGTRTPQRFLCYNPPLGSASPRVRDQNYC